MEVSVSGLGEFELIDRLAALVANSASPRLEIGIGDDAAAWSPMPNAMAVATTDALIEGVHFDLATTDWRDLGWKALAENVSDVAAMGCAPRYALVALGLPPSTRVADVEALYHGMRECARTFGCSVVGGDVVRAPCVVLGVTVIGESLPISTCEHGDVLLRRSRARPSDVIAVTGPLGGSAAGLRLLQSQGARAEAALSRECAEVMHELLALHRRPVPRVVAGHVLVEAGVQCAIDVSDGLVADVGHVCKQSGVDAELDATRVPVHPAVVACFGAEALELALTGGEDYELVCAGPAERIALASERLRERGEPPLIVIGTILPMRGATPEVRVIGAAGEALPLGRGGYRHF